MTQLLEIRTYGSNEWGCDIVGGATTGYAGAPWYLNGTSDFEASGNAISNSWFGGSVFDEPANGAGTYANNAFTPKSVPVSFSMLRGAMPRNTNPLP
jgi:hypothetical protein